MNKKILRLISFFILLATFSLTNATQQVLELNPYETKYTSNYKVTNNTNKKILAPISDTSGNILNNYKGISSDINNLKNSFFTFGSNQKINNSYTVGGFTISDAGFSKTYGSRSSCSATCGGGTKFRTVTCDREDGVFGVGSLCGLTSNIETVSCNTQPCSSSCSSQTSYTRQNVPLADALVGYIPGTSWAAAVKYNCRYNNGFGRWYYGHATARSWAYEAYNHGSQCKVGTTYTVCNGECGTTNNSCTTGTLTDIADTSTEYKWQCSGTNGGTTTNCSINKPVNCVGSWSDTSTCSETCGGGVKQQVYTITTPASNGGVACSNNTGDVKWGTTSCNTQACGSWTCKATICDEASRTIRGIECNGGVNGVCNGFTSGCVINGLNPGEASASFASCMTNGYPSGVHNTSFSSGTLPVIDCIGNWSDTSTCSETCGGGVKQQVYTITTPASNGGVVCSNNTGDTRWGSTSCNTQACSTVVSVCNEANLGKLNSNGETCFTATEILLLINGGGVYDAYQCYYTDIKAQNNNYKCFPPSLGGQFIPIPTNKWNFIFKNKNTLYDWSINQGL